MEPLAHWLTGTGWTTTASTLSDSFRGVGQFLIIAAIIALALRDLAFRSVRRSQQVLVEALKAVTQSMAELENQAIDRDRRIELLTDVVSRLRKGMLIYGCRKMDCPHRVVFADDAEVSESIFG